MTRKEELINHIKEYLDSGMWKYAACYLGKEDLEVIIKALEELKTGHWIETGNIGYIGVDNVVLYQEMCDKCKGLSYFRKSADKLIGAGNCPNCGAKMEEISAGSESEG